MTTPIADSSSAQLETLQLAALLHDVGKFWQRADLAEPDTVRDLVRDLAQYATNREEADGAWRGDLENRRRAGRALVGDHGAHAWWSAAFIAKHVPETWRRSGWAALTHHKPLDGDRTARIVALADRLAAAERRPLEEEGEPAGPRQLRSVLANVSGQENCWRFRAGGHYYPLAPLGTYDERMLFPTDQLYDERTCRERYRVLWNAFVTEHAQVPAASFHAYFTSLYFLLQKYTWCVPSAYYNAEPDISLFDHARMTCALATCLWLDGIPDGELTELLRPAPWGDAAPHELSKAAEQERFLLVGGDVSGVQRFLYTVSSNGALRGLRGRSFYLQLLAQGIVRRLLRAWKLTPANLIYEGGGRFYLLAPLPARRSLPDLRRRLTEVLLEHHKGSLFVALAGVAISAADLQHPAGLTEAFERVSQALNQAKRRKGEGLATDYLVANLFTPQKTGGRDHQACRVCREENNAAPSDPPEDSADERLKCLLCRGLEHLGDQLRRGSRLVLWEREAALEMTSQGREAAAPPSRETAPGHASPSRGDWQAALRDLGLGAEVLRERDRGSLDGIRGQIPPGSHVTVLRLQDADLAGTATDLRRLGLEGAAVGFQLLAQATPLSANEPGEIADFEELAKASTGIKRLGYLRADADNLGNIFLYGLQERGADGRTLDRGTVSRRAALSFTLRLFFEGHLSVLCDRWNPGANGQSRGGAGDARGPHRLYIIYGGGDDLFIAGAWDAAAEVAGEIAASFSRFAGGNPAVHLSAGITLQPPKYPLYQAAADAGEALEAAKDSGRNAVQFLGRTRGWQEFAAARERSLALQELVNVGTSGGLEPSGSAGAARALLRTIAAACTGAAAERRRQREQATGRWLSANSSAENEEAAQVPWGRWMWLAVYQLTRSAERASRAAPGVAAHMMALRELLLTPAGLRELEVAVRWAELLLRTRDEQE